MKMLLALCILLAPAPAIAQSLDYSKSGVGTAVPVRYELVYEIAKIICPRAEKVGNRLEELITSVRDRANLSEDEVTVLLNYCLMFQRGVLHANGVTP